MNQCGPFVYSTLRACVVSQWMLVESSCCFSCGYAYICVVLWLCCLGEKCNKWFAESEHQEMSACVTALLKFRLTSFRMLCVIPSGTESSPAWYNTTCDDSGKVTRTIQARKAGKPRNGSPVGNENCINTSTGPAHKVVTANVFSE